MDEWETDLQGSGRDLIDLLPRYLPGGTEENHKISRFDCPCAGRDSNRAAPK
jgi:hypothetical protein